MRLAHYVPDCWFHATNHIWAHKLRGHANNAWFLAYCYNWLLILLFLASFVCWGCVWLFFITQCGKITISICHKISTSSAVPRNLRDEQIKFMSVCTLSLSAAVEQPPSHPQLHIARGRAIPHRSRQGAAHYYIYYIHGETSRRSTARFKSLSGPPSSQQAAAAPSRCMHALSVAGFPNAAVQFVICILIVRPCSLILGRPCAHWFGRGGGVNKRRFYIVGGEEINFGRRRRFVAATHCLL